MVSTLQIGYFLAIVVVSWLAEQACDKYFQSSNPVTNKFLSKEVAVLKFVSVSCTTHLNNCVGKIIMKLVVLVMKALRQKEFLE